MFILYLGLFTTLTDVVVPGVDMDAQGKKHTGTSDSIFRKMPQNKWMHYLFAKVAFLLTPFKILLRARLTIIAEYLVS